MAAAQPQTIADSIDQRLQSRVIAMTRYIEEDDFQLNQMRREIEKLRSVDSAQASLLVARVLHTHGDIEGMDGQLRNARQLKLAEQRVAYEEYLCCANLSLASRALGAFRQAVDVKFQNIEQNIRNVMAFGGFQTAAVLNNQAELAKITLLMDSPLASILSASKTLAPLGVTDEMCASVVDAAGEVLRGRKLFWSGTSPDMIVNEQDSSVGLWMRVDTTPQEATEMSLEAIDKLIERDLDRLPFYVTFVGTRV